MKNQQSGRSYYHMPLSLTTSPSIRQPAILRSILLYGRDVTLPDAIIKRQNIYNYDNYVKMLIRELHDAWSIAQRMMLKNKIQNKSYSTKRSTIQILKSANLCS